MQLMLLVKQENQRELLVSKHIQVLLSYNLVKGNYLTIFFIFSRAELATEEYIPVENVILENFILIKDNPDYEEED